VVIVDDHLALLAVAGQRLEFGAPGPVATTTGFQFQTGAGGRWLRPRRQPVPSNP
jgi:hypothetical protein